MSRKWRSSKEKLENWEKGVRGGDWSDGKVNCFSVSFLRQLGQVSMGRAGGESKMHTFVSSTALSCKVR